MSLLRSDIFKITQLLKTAAENSQEQNESMSRWLADISHQLKTPIASIRIDLDNMMDDPDMPPEISDRLIAERAEEKAQAKDIHEKDAEYLHRCHAAYLELAAKYGWKKVACASDGAIRGIEEIHEDVYREIMAMGV